MQESERRALEDLENNIPYDYCRSCDSPDGLYHEYIDEESWQYKIKILLEEKDKEIEFHKNNERIAIDCQNKLNEEIEKLNNIINELEKDFERKIQSCTIEAETTTNDFYCRLHIATLKKWLNKIQELKGDGIVGN